MAKEDLGKRLYTFLQKVHEKHGDDRWIHSTSMKELAYSRGYSNQEFWNAVRWLETRAQIAKISGGFYRYLNMTWKEEQELQKQLDEF